MEMMMNCATGAQDQNPAKGNPLTQVLKPQQIYMNRRMRAGEKQTMPSTNLADFGQEMRTEMRNPNQLESE